MLSQAELQDVLQAPAESTVLDFKREVGWASARARFDLAKDVVCLANRNGGHLVYGVEELGPGKYAAKGLATTDRLPDATEVAQMIAKYFDPTPEIEVAHLEVGGKTFGVIRVQEFRQTPHIAKTTVSDGGKAVIAQGAVYRRTPALTCEQISDAVSMAELVFAAASKTGALTAAILGSSIPRLGGAPTPTPTEELPMSASGTALRACTVVLDPKAQQSMAELAGALDAATVLNRYGDAFLPRQIVLSRLGPSDWVREPRRILAESRSREGTTSVVQVGADGAVTMSELLWEAAGSVSFTGLMTYTIAALLFAFRYGTQLGAARVAVSVGLLHPAGLVLSDDPTLYAPFYQTYTATSTTDIWVGRERPLIDLGDAEKRAVLARDMVVELVWYFGWTNLTEQTWDAHLKWVRGNYPDT